MPEDSENKTGQSSDSQEEKTIITNAGGALPQTDDAATIIRDDSNETRMGEMPDMGLLAIGARFIVMSKQNSGQEFILANKEMVIGRGDDCNLKLDYPGVSRAHFRLTFEEKSFFVEDMGSKFGTFIGSKKINGRTRVVSGDLIQIGELTLRFVTSEGASSSIRNRKILFFAAFVLVFLVVLLLVKILSGGASHEVAVPAGEPLASQNVSQPQPQVKTLSLAKNLFLQGKNQEALDKISETLASDPLNREALDLQRQVQSKMELSAKIESARKLIDIGSLEQARITANEALTLCPDSAEGKELLNRIEKAGKSKEAFGKIQEAKALLSSGNSEGARKLLAQVSDPAMEKEAGEVAKQIESFESVKQSLSLAQESFDAGNMDEALSKLKEGISKNGQDEKLLNMKQKIEMLLAARKEADNFMGGSAPFKAKAPLQKIVDGTGPSNPWGKKAEAELAQIQSQGLIMAETAYQEALRHYADGELKQSLEQLEQLCLNFPEIEYFKDVKNELRVRADNMAKALYHAAYVLEEKDPMKAKEILQRLYNYLPENHPYAKKVRAKIRY